MSSMTASPMRRRAAAASETAPPAPKAAEPAAAALEIEPTPPAPAIRQAAAAQAPAPPSIAQPEAPTAANDAEPLRPNEAAPVGQAAAGTASTETQGPREGAGVRGAPDTVAALAADIVRKLEGRSTRFEVELQPAGLGRVEVRIEIGAGGKLTAAFAVDSPQAAAELRSRSPELQRALEQAGFDLSGGLSFDTADGGRFGRDPEARHGGGGFPGRAFAEALAAGDAADQAALPPRYSSRPSAALDIRI